MAWFENARRGWKGQGTQLDLAMVVTVPSTVPPRISCLSRTERECCQCLCSSQDEEGWRENTCLRGCLGPG